MACRLAVATVAHPCRRALAWYSRECWRSPFAFGLAATRPAPKRKAAIVDLFTAISHTTITIVRRVLWAAPQRVFALSLGDDRAAAPALMASR